MKKEIQSNYKLKIDDFYNIPFSNVKKYRKCVLQFTTLVKDRIENKKIIRCELEFNQWLKPDI